MMLVPLKYDKVDRENVFYMLAMCQLRLLVDRVVSLCRDMQLLCQTHNPNLGARFHHPSYFDIGKYALFNEEKYMRINLSFILHSY